MQFARCMSNRYKEHNFPRCVACTRRWAGDTCRFQGIRFFLKDFEETIVGISFVESSTSDGPTLDFPKQWNRPLEPQFIRNMKVIQSHDLPGCALINYVRSSSQKHFCLLFVRKWNISGYPRLFDALGKRMFEQRAVCRIAYGSVALLTRHQDTCMTSIFSSSWLCRICGREACAECFEKVKEFTSPAPDASPDEISAAQARRERYAHINPSFLSCTRRNEHSAKDFSPMSRFCTEELSKAIEEMEALQDQKLSVHLGANGKSAEESTDVDSIHNAPATDIPESSTESAYVPPGLSETTSSTPSHELRRVPDEVLTFPMFDKIWSRGEPFVVTNVLRKFNLKWTPEYFTEKYGKESCLIIECQTDTNKRVTVEQFFGKFGSYEGRRESWKLKVS